MASSLLDRRNSIRRYTASFDGEDTHAANEKRFGDSPLSRDAYGGAAGYQYRRQSEAYGRALRQLRRRGRRGDTGAVLDEIAVRDQANRAGFSPGGIRSQEDHAVAARGYGERLREERDIARQADSVFRRRIGEGLGYDPNDAFVDDEDPMARFNEQDEYSDTMSADTTPGTPRRRGRVNKNSFEGAGYGDPIGRRRRAYERPEDEVPGGYSRLLSRRRF